MHNNKYKLLVVEDEKNINHFICALLEANGYQAVPVQTGTAAQMVFSSHRPDLVILDLGLPDMDGMELLKQIRLTGSTPVIVLSARSSETDKVAALDLGANDYITKPFGSAELVARVRTALRVTRHTAQSHASGGRFLSGNLSIDYDARMVCIHGQPIKLTQTEYNILALLSQHPGKVMTYAAIIRQVWGYNDPGSTKKLQVNMANIRKKLGDRPGQKNHIVNELGVGYRMNQFVGDAEDDPSADG